MEERATTAGFLNMFRNLVMEVGLKPGESVLDVGTGTGILARWLANQTRGENAIIGMDINSYLVNEATKLAQKAGLEDVINFREGNGESLPFQDNTFDFSFSVTALEEGDADKMISEMIRVTKPGGRVGAIVRALDIPFVINLPLRPDLKKKAEGFPNGLVDEKGCADASLYRRFRQAGMTEVKGSPQFATYDKTSPRTTLGHLLALTFNRLNQDEQSEWSKAMSAKEAEDSFFISGPHHCVIGTKPS
jgi:ubiquinone/menaquinone biosynthesis C-methylase UbiE